eukprot:gene3674-13749_t
MAHYKHAMMAGGASDHTGKTFVKEIASKKVIDMLFDKILADVELAYFFEGVDMEYLKKKQEVMMDVMFGGLQALETVYLREAHLEAIKHRGLTERHWERFVKHFEVTLRELSQQIPEEKRKSAVANIRATRMYFAPARPGE